MAAAIAGRGDATLLNGDHASAVRGRNLGGAIRGIVIGYDDFDRPRPAGIIRPGYLDRIQQPWQVTLFVVSGDDY